MKVLTVVRNVAILITEPVFERGLPFTGVPEHVCAYLQACQLVRWKFSGLLLGFDAFLVKLLILWQEKFY